MFYIEFVKLITMDVFLSQCKKKVEKPKIVTNIISV